MEIDIQKPNSLTKLDKKHHKSVLKVGKDVSTLSKEPTNVSLKT